MNRRSLLLGLGGALAAPAVVRAESLMKLWVPPKRRLVATLDDYEEGYFTPSVTFTESTGRTFTLYPSVPSRYIRVGREVRFEGRIPAGSRITGAVVTFPSSNARMSLSL